MNKAAIGSSSSEATESENSCTERYEYEKKPGSEREDEENEEEEEEDEEGEEIASSEENKRNGISYETPGCDEKFNELDFLRDDPAGRARLHDRFFIHPEEQQQQFQYQRSKRTNFQRPASLKSVNSYEYRESVVGRRHMSVENNGEHYMVPTHEPNRANDKRSLSLFNPDFLPNFNDMLMYVGNTGITRERDYYRCNLDPNDWPAEANDTPIIDFSDHIYGQHNPGDVPDEADVYNLGDEPPDYATVRQIPLDVRDQRGQDCENVYAPVGFHPFEPRSHYDC